jgi:hypothetical protein
VLSDLAIGAERSEHAPKQHRVVNDILDNSVAIPPQEVKNIGIWQP